MHKKSILLYIILLFLFPGVIHAQKTRVMSVIQMIDQGKYEEGRDAIELALWNEKTANWHRTHYTKGLLCQTAYEEGYKKKDSKLTGLYPDQLFLAHESYEKALELDVRGRTRTFIAQNYYRLSNDFRVMGSDHFKKGEYEKAFRAFEHALIVNNSELVKAPVDTNLVHNTAIAAYEAEMWDKAVLYLTGLHDVSHKPSSSLLLYEAHMHLKDTLRAEEVLEEALELYDYERQIVVYLINLLVRTDRSGLAIKVLDEALIRRPAEHQFYWARALIYRRLEEFDLAVRDFRKAIELKPEEATLYYHIGVIYYNRGIEIREAALGIHENERYLRLRDQAREQFLEALVWLEKSYELNPFDDRTISRLHQLYYQLQMKEKEEAMRLLLQ